MSNGEGRTAGYQGTFMRVIRAIIGLMLLPCCVAVSRTVLFAMASWGMPGRHMPAPPVLALVGGFVLWLLLFHFLPKPTRTYVLAHELSHMIWGTVMGARVSGIRVSKEGGHVRLSDHNFLTVLAPYFFPLYAVAVILSYYLLSVFVDVSGYYLVWLGLVGFTLGFHFSFTVAALSQPQPDIKEYGRLFSYAVIYLLSILEIGALIIMVSPSVTLDLFVRRLAADMAGAWVWCWSALWAGAQFVISRCQ